MTLVFSILKLSRYSYICTNNKHNVKNEFGILQLEIKDDDIQKQRRARSKKYLPDYRLYPFDIGKMIFLQDEQKINSLLNSEKNSSLKTCE